jgi:hypothetical protein
MRTSAFRARIMSEGRLISVQIIVHKFPFNRAQFCRTPVSPCSFAVAALAKNFYHKAPRFYRCLSTLPHLCHRRQNRLRRQVLEAARLGAGNLPAAAARRLGA